MYWTDRFFQYNCQPFGHTPFVELVRSTGRTLLDLGKPRRNDGRSRGRIKRNHLGWPRPPGLPRPETEKGSAGTAVTKILTTCVFNRTFDCHLLLFSLTKHSSQTERRGRPLQFSPLTSTSTGPANNPLPYPS
ncbi:hypothetical protein VTK73DRAFT_569 [Phialemonium thermophilum]|uniref:Uncharacterized protein n=1 Tax=Phialemonium thermophilum TaxID=223376 RepID=A0ABR3XDI4_9PEZI